MITFTEWATEILQKSQTAARRFDPQARLRIARTPAGVQAVLVHDPDPDDTPYELDGVTVFVEEGLGGLVDIEEPHDRLVLRPAGSTPNAREH